MATIKRKPKRVRVFKQKPKPRRHPGPRRITQPPPDTTLQDRPQGSFFLPTAEAMPAPFIVRPAVLAGKNILQKFSQVKGQKALKPGKGRKGKTLYRPSIELLEPVSLGVIKTRNGKPRFSSNYTSFMKKKPDKVFGNLTAKTRAHQSVISSKLKKHTVTRTQYTQVIPGGPRHLKSLAHAAAEFGRSQTRYDKRDYPRVVASKRLTTGVPPTIGVVKSPGDQLAHSTYTKFIAGDTKPEPVFKQKTLFGAAGATAAGAAWYDQAANFNLLPEAAGMGGAPLVNIPKNVIRAMAQWQKANPKGTYTNYLRETKQKRNNTLKSQFKLQKELLKEEPTQEVSQVKPSGGIKGPSDKVQLKNLAFTLGGFGGLVGAAAVVSEAGWLDQGPMDPTPPVVVQPEQEHAPSSVVPPGHEYDTLAPLTAADFMSQNKSLQEMQDAKMLGLQTAAAAGPSATPGGSAKGSRNEGWTEVTYDRYVPQVYASDHEKAGQRKKGKVEEYSQWMRFTPGFTEAKFLASQASVLKSQQLNDLHQDLLTTVGKIDPGKRDSKGKVIGMRAQALAAEKFYQKNPELGKLPTQWNIILDATKPTNQEAYNEAWKQHQEGDEGKGYRVDEWSRLKTDSEGKEIPGDYAIESTSSGFPYAVPFSTPPTIGSEVRTEKKYYPTDPDDKDYVKGKVGQVMPTSQYWLNYPTPSADTTPPPETEIPGTTLSGGNPNAITHTTSAQPPRDSYLRYDGVQKYAWMDQKHGRAQTISEEYHTMFKSQNEGIGPQVGEGLSDPNDASSNYIWDGRYWWDRKDYEDRYGPGNITAS